MPYAICDRIRKEFIDKRSYKNIKRSGSFEKPKAKMEIASFLWCHLSIITDFGYLFPLCHQHDFKKEL